jgi:hypothetical protein
MNARPYPKAQKPESGTKRRLMVCLWSAIGGMFAGNIWCAAELGINQKELSSERAAFEQERIAAEKPRQICLGSGYCSSNINDIVEHMTNGSAGKLALTTTAKPDHSIAAPLCDDDTPCWGQTLPKDWP